MQGFTRIITPDTRDLRLWTRDLDFGVCVLGWFDHEKTPGRDMGTESSSSTEASGVFLCVSPDWPPPVPKTPGHRLAPASLAAVVGTGRFSCRFQEGGGVHRFAALPRIATRQLLCG